MNVHFELKRQTSIERTEGIAYTGKGSAQETPLNPVSMKLIHTTLPSDMYDVLQVATYPGGTRDCTACGGPSSGGRLVAIKMTSS